MSANKHNSDYHLLLRDMTQKFYFYFFSISWNFENFTSISKYCFATRTEFHDTEFTLLCARKHFNLITFDFVVFETFKDFIFCYFGISVQSKKLLNLILYLSSSANRKWWKNKFLILFTSDPVFDSHSTLNVGKLFNSIYANKYISFQVSLRESFTSYDVP